MKRLIKRWLLAVGLWLVRLGGIDEGLVALAWLDAVWVREVLQVALRLTPEALELRAEAKRVCGFIEESSAEGTSGEWKRHRALAALKKTHPQVTHSDIALAIELAVPLVKEMRL